jgi:quercetin dioxygenase-like cupin family protein
MTADCQTIEPSIVNRHSKTGGVVTGRIQGFCAGLVVGLMLAGGWMVTASGVSATRQAGVKYPSKVVLENDQVRVKDVTFPPGVLDTGMHTHDLPHVGIILSKGTLRFTEPDGTSEDVEFELGSVGYREADARHQVSNPGKEPMRVIEVEIK